MGHTTLMCPYLSQKRQFLAGTGHEIVLWPNDFESCWQNTQNINSSLSGSQELGTLSLIVIRFLDNFFSFFTKQGFVIFWLVLFFRFYKARFRDFLACPLLPLLANKVA